mmetsp:Transcript_43307/g.90963  ORF Transcript_43307/g.90963 Transcript_43307/m.90963 type:complete len:121 (+) Transcript_43307:322-684(+)
MDSVMAQHSVLTNQNGNWANPIVRVGRDSSCHVKVQPLLAQSIACEAGRKDSRDLSTLIEKPSVDYLHKVVSAAKVVGVTARLLNLVTFFAICSRSDLTPRITGFCFDSSSQSILGGAAL